MKPWTDNDVQQSLNRCRVDPDSIPRELYNLLMLGTLEELLDYSLRTTKQLDEKYNEGYEDAKQDSTSEYDNGYSQGFDDGMAERSNDWQDGYDEGYSQGLTDTE